jgi:hypothetical protein
MCVTVAIMVNHPNTHFDILWNIRRDTQKLFAHELNKALARGLHLFIKI